MNIFSQKKKRPKYQAILYFVLILFISFLWQFHTTKIAALPELGQPISLYSNQASDDLRGTLLNGIHKAEKSILLIIYSLTDERIIQALRRKGEEGVSVKVICDPKASAYVHKKLGPNVFVQKRYCSGLMHQKILVIDEMETWIGSANMTQESLRVHGNLLMGAHHVELAKLICLKADRMMMQGTQEPILHNEFEIGGQHVEFWFLPDDKNAVETLHNLIQTAKKTIRVAMFTWTRYDLAKDLIAAQKRGVDAEVVIDYTSGKGASAKVVKMLRDGGVPVYLSQGNGLLHHKFAYIDGDTLVNGSANWTLAAFTKNDDCFMIIHNLTSRQKEKLENLWEVISMETVQVK